MNFPKHYDISLEKELYQSRVDRGFFSPEKVAAARSEIGLLNRDEAYTIMLPPPNVTGKLHIGHAMMVAVEDALVRHARMK